MRQHKLNLKTFLAFLLLIMAIAFMTFNSPPQKVLAQDIPTPTPEVEVQIVGGGPASPGEWPWQVALVNGGATDLFQDQFCGGSLIDPQWVLTAGHCVTEGGGSVSDPTSLDVVAGIYNLVTPAVGYQRRDVYQIIRHPLYNNATLDNDIALIQLSSSVTLGGSGETSTALVPLAPASSGSFVNASSWVTGWGKIATDPNAWDERLFEVNIPVISNSGCSLYWSGINQNNICAGVVEDPPDTEGKDACNGDSGGPLVISIASIWTLAGVVSSGSADCGSAPGIYTRVSQYTNWINSITPTHFVSAITRQTASPTYLASVNFAVTFPVAMTGVDVTDFTLTTSGVSGAAISGVSGAGTSYTVTVNTGSGDGTIHLNLVDDDTIRNSNFSPLGGTGTGNGSYLLGETYTIDKTLPVVSTIVRDGVDPNGAVNVFFVVTFSEPVIGVDLNDFSLTTSGVSGAALMSLSGSGATRIVTVNSGSYDGTIRLDLTDNDSITDIAGNVLGGAGSNNFIGGESYAIDKPDLAKPSLLSPGNASITSDTTPTFQWKKVPRAQTYEIEIASDVSFTTIVYGNNSVATPHTPSSLPEGLYYWHVRAYNAANQAGAWSLTRTFTIDTTGPLAPVLLAPSGTITTRSPNFRWSPSSTAVIYEFQYCSDVNCVSPIYTVTMRGTSRKFSRMPTGTYYWRVRAKDAYGNIGPWSVPFTFTITP